MVGLEIYDIILLEALVEKSDAAVVEVECYAHTSVVDKLLPDGFCCGVVANAFYYEHCLFFVYGACKGVAVVAVAGFC